MNLFKKLTSLGCEDLCIATAECACDEDELKLLSTPSVISGAELSRVEPDDCQNMPSQWSERLSDNSSFSNAWLLKSPPQLHAVAPTSSLSLGNRIIAGTSYWSSSLRLRGEFCYTPLYWEWLENAVSCGKEILIKARIFDVVCCSRHIYDRDVNIMRAFCEVWCPDFNTLETSCGTLSISLWDLHILGGLPIYGEMNEEIVPSAKELVDSGSHEGIVPKSCRHLFAAFFRSYEAKDGKKIVQISSWIDLWFRGAKRYHKPAKCGRKIPRCLEDTRNPIEPIPEVSPWSIEDQGVFEDLGVEEEARLPTYLSAFITCWLWLFVFPENDPYIRPQVFRAASLMATGRCFGLAVPVLTTLY